MPRKKRSSSNISFWISGLIAGIVIGAIGISIVFFLQDRQVVSDRHQGVSADAFAP